MSFCGHLPRRRRKLRRSPIRERRPKWVNGRIKRYGPSRRERAILLWFARIRRTVMPAISDARNNSYVLTKLFAKPRVPVTGKFLVWPMEYGRSKP